MADRRPSMAKAAKAARRRRRRRPSAAATAATIARQQARAIAGAPSARMSAASRAPIAPRRSVKHAERQQRRARSSAATTRRAFATPSASTCASARIVRVERRDVTDASTTTTAASPTTTARRSAASSTTARRGWRKRAMAACPRGRRRSCSAPPCPAAWRRGARWPLSANGIATTIDIIYRNDGDYIYRVNREGGLIDALFPFQDRDYSYYPVGMTYPAEYNSYNVPYQYQSFYPDSNDYTYRYGDGAIYQVDRSTNAIESIVPARRRSRRRAAAAGRLWRLQCADGLSRPLL